MRFSRCGLWSVESVSLRGKFCNSVIDFFVLSPAAFWQALSGSVRWPSLRRHHTLCMCMLDILVAPQGPGKTPFSLEPSCLCMQWCMSLHKHTWIHRQRNTCTDYTFHVLRRLMLRSHFILGVRSFQGGHKIRVITRTSSKRTPDNEELQGPTYRKHAA